MIRGFHLADFFTLANAACGVGGVLLAMLYMQAGSRAHFYAAAAMAPLAFFFDWLDGNVARWRHQHSALGRELDSLADVISFGVAPAVLAYVWGYGATLAEGSELHRLAWFLSFMYLICGAFRLARFNVQASRPRILAEGTPKVDKKSFVGLPIPVAGGLIAALVHFAPSPLVYYGPDRARLYSGLLMALVGFLSVLMISTWRFSSFKTVGTRVRSMRTIILALSLLIARSYRRDAGEEVGGEENGGDQEGAAHGGTSGTPARAAR